MENTWEEVKPGQSVGFSQGWALNYLGRKYRLVKMELGWVEDKEEGLFQAYRVTLLDGRVAVYADKGDSLVQYQ